MLKPPTRACTLMFPSCAVVPSFFCGNFPYSFSYPPVSLSSAVDSVLFWPLPVNPFLSLQVSVCTSWTSALCLHGPLCMIPFLGFWTFLTLSESGCRPIQVTRLSLCEWGFCSSGFRLLCHTEVQSAGLGLKLRNTGAEPCLTSPPSGVLSGKGTCTSLLWWS